MTTEAQQLMEAAFAGTLNLDANTSEAFGVSAADTPVPSNTLHATDDPAGATAAQDDEQAGAPIASKSGSYTIPYEKLSEARSERDTLKAERDALQAQLSQLSAQQSSYLESAQQESHSRADAGTASTEADQNLAVAQQMLNDGADISLFGDFSEEAISKGIKQSVALEVRAVLDAEKAQAQAQTQAMQQQDAAQAHHGAIFQAHPDAAELYESSQFKDWVKGQPAFVQKGIEATMTQGATAEVIDVFSQFKAAKGIAPTKSPAAPAAPAALQETAPFSLSALPGAAPAGSTEVQRAMDMASDPLALMEHFMGMSPDKATKLMNSVL